MELKRGAINAFDDAGTFMPRNLREGLIAYIEIGRPVGSFLNAVLCNDLQKAVQKSDPINSHHLASIVKWLWNYAHRDCHGSESNVRGWMDARANDLNKEVENVA